jgi:hypothetical protein
MNAARPPARVMAGPRAKPEDRLRPATHDLPWRGQQATHSGAVRLAPADKRLCVLAPRRFAVIAISR